MTFTSSLKEKLAKMRRDAEERAAQRMAEKLGQQYTDFKGKPLNVDAMGLIKEEEAKQAKVAAVETKKNQLALLSFDPRLPEAQKTVKNLESKGFKIFLYIVSLSTLNEVWDFYKFVPKEHGEITARIEIEEGRLAELKNILVSLESVSDSIENLQSVSGVRAGEILETVLAGAMAMGASDIHFEPEGGAVGLRFRIDGILHNVLKTLDKNIYLYLLSRIKLLSGMKLNVHEEPQDGRFTIRLSGKEIEVRVAISPSKAGEVVVMRLLDPDIISLGLKELGIREDDLRIIMEELKMPNGMLLNSGPTGSGKTTTLYAFLKYKKTPEKKIITIEDPVEYHLGGIEQTQVDEEAGYTFANGLRSIMRQDPDVILVGEIRDKETAEIALQSALTGHLVFSTVHANSASGVIPRLIDLGVRTSSIGPAVNLIIAQRLVRRLCQNCKKPVEISSDLRKKLETFLGNLPNRVNREDYKNIAVFKPDGCEKCNKFGYKGRVAIYELLLVGPEIEELINSEVGEVKIKNFSQERGMVTMQEDGILKAITGATSFEEVEEITGPLEF